MLRYGTRILLIDVERSHLDINECGLDMSVTHQLHECGQTHAGAYHVGGKGVPEPMRVSQRHSGGLAMIPKQRAQSRRRHSGAACRSLQGDKQCVVS